MCHIAPRHILELTLEFILEFTLEVILEFTLETAFFYQGFNIGEKVMILFVVIVLELSQDSS
jgi:hypothetical protein